MMRILNYLAVLAVAVGMMGWSMKNGLETDVENLQEFRSRGIETTAQVLSREIHTSTSRRGRKRESYTYRIEHVLPSGQKVWSRLPAPDFSYDTATYPFPISIWYLPED
ncbi:MAG TPA: hypothetical protein VD994_07270, partial [Prosthecobacter sp.]|nr:hypothetical protein [Prosthecobacter sp.]